MAHSLEEQNISRFKQITIVVFIAILVGTVSLTSVPANQMLEEQKEASNSHRNVYDPGYQEGSVFTGTPVALGEDHGCVIFDYGNVSCWGDNSKGQLGVGDTTDYATPQSVDLGEGRTALSITAGDYHTCAILDDATAKCWGDNSEGQLGTGNSNDATTPALVSGGHSYATITAGSQHTCAILDTGAVYCWGDNSNGQLGDDTTTDKNQPTQIAGTGLQAISLSAGGSHTCLVTSQGLADERTTKCWGDNTYGQLGDSSNTDSSSPAWISNSNHVSITAGSDHTCAIVEDGSMECWGRNSHTQLGQDSSVGTTAKNSPQEVMFGGISQTSSPVQSTTTATGVTSNASFDVKYLDADNWEASPTNGGAGYTTGDEITLLIGTTVIDYTINSNDLNTNNEIYVKLTEGSLPYVKSMTLGKDLTCIIDSTDSIECVGDNYEGQIGVGYTSNYVTNLQSINVNNAIGITANGHTVCSVLSSDDFDCWGDNSAKIIANTNTNYYTTPNTVNLNNNENIMKFSRDYNEDGILNIFIDYSSTSDSDFDGIVDSDDDYDNNPARSVECAAGKFGRHYCQDAYPGHKVTSAGEVG